MLTVVAAWACSGSGGERANDTAVGSQPLPVDAGTVPAVTTAWDTAAGPVFLVMGASADQGALIVPDIDSAAALDTLAIPTGDYRNLGLELYRDGRLVGAATAGDAIARDVPDDCSTWPALRLASRDTSAWTVAFPTGRFSPLGTDSLAGLRSADSLRLTRELARVASAAPDDTVEALRGVPYVVHRAWWGILRSQRRFVLAEINRTLNQEANPQHEHLLVLGERDSSATRWEMGWSERASGGEETLASIDLLAAGYAKGRDEPILLLARYLGDGVVYSLLVRDENGRWRNRWSSPYAGC
jgi:hypothetical protein